MGRGAFFELWHFEKYFIKNSRTKNQTGKNFGFFLQDKFSNCILNEKFNSKISKIRTLFLKIRALSSNFQESAGETSPSCPSSYAPVVIRKYRIPLLTKFAIVKLKIDLFTVSMIFLKNALRWHYLLLILYSALYIAYHNENRFLD